MRIGRQRSRGLCRKTRLDCAGQRQHTSGSHGGVTTPRRVVILGSAFGLRPIVRIGAWMNPPATPAAVSRWRAPKRSAPLLLLCLLVGLAVGRFGESTNQMVMRTVFGPNDGPKPSASGSIVNTFYSAEVYVDGQSAPRRSSCNMGRVGMIFQDGKGHMCLCARINPREAEWVTVDGSYYDCVMWP